MKVLSFHLLWKRLNKREFSFVSFVFTAFRENIFFSNNITSRAVLERTWLPKPPNMTPQNDLKTNKQHNQQQNKTSPTQNRKRRPTSQKSAPLTTPYLRLRLLMQLQSLQASLKALSVIRLPPQPRRCLPLTTPYLRLRLVVQLQSLQASLEALSVIRACRPCIKHPAVEPTNRINVSKQRIECMNQINESGAKRRNLVQYI